ncbi:uncharacterized protein LOC105736807 [Apis florea]|uniref:uncharacterized protein LOC105736807 n=1 Tax=Apis florea TaxID=7463 RepID=UPI0012FE8AF5|nr:uncharacterized protein LOC105736807 [Apis florea]
MILINLFYIISKEERQKFNLSILIYIIIATMYLGIFTFTIFVSILQDKLHKMNKIIKEVYELSNTKDIDERYKIQSHIAHKFIIIMDYYNRKHFVQHFLQVTRYVHFEILKLSRELNQAYTYQILFDLIMQFSLLLCTLYNEYFYLISLKFSKALSDKQSIGFLIWICLYFTKIICINNQCTKFYHEVEVTAYLLRKLDICYLDNFIRNEVQQFLLQLSLHPLKFTAGGYILNNKLSTMIFGTIITYLIVLIQMSSSPSLMKSLNKSL